MYGWTFEQIADMSPLQHLVAISKGQYQGEVKTMYFSTDDEYRRWLATRNVA